jgi:hypothetical protein
MTPKLTTTYVVRVRAYARTRNGRAEWVRKHLRSQQVTQLNLPFGSLDSPATPPRRGEDHPDGIRTVRMLSGRLPDATTTSAIVAKMLTTRDPDRRSPAPAEFTGTLSPRHESDADPGRTEGEPVVDVRLKSADGEAQP